MNPVHCKKWGFTKIDLEGVNRENVVLTKKKIYIYIETVVIREPESQAGLFWLQSQGRQKIGWRDWPGDESPSIITWERKIYCSRIREQEIFKENLNMENFNSILLPLWMNGH